MGDVRIRRLSRLLRARLGYAAGCAVAVAGVVVEFGIGVGLMVGGVLTAASFLVLVDVDEDKGGDGDGR